jgi:hypothetical protein
VLKSQTTSTGGEGPPLPLPDINLYPLILEREDAYKLISETAYYRAEKRGFTPGYEINDWIDAEGDVLNFKDEDE